MEQTHTHHQAHAATGRASHVTEAVPLTAVVTAPPDCKTPRRSQAVHPGSGGTAALRAPGVPKRRPQVMPRVCPNSRTSWGEKHETPLPYLLVE